MQTRIFPIKTVSKGENTCLMWKSFPLKTAVSLGVRKKSITFAPTNTKQHKNMSLIRVILCIVFPPLAVIDKGCGSILITLLLTLCGWVPGVIAALIINNK